MYVACVFLYVCALEWDPGPGSMFLCGVPWRHPPTSALFSHQLESHNCGTSQASVYVCPVQKGEGLGSASRPLLPVSPDCVSVGFQRATATDSTGVKPLRNHLTTPHTEMQNSLCCPLTVWGTEMDGGSLHENTEWVLVCAMGHSQIQEKPVSTDFTASS